KKPNCGCEYFYNREGKPENKGNCILCMWHRNQNQIKSDKPEEIKHAPIIELNEDGVKIYHGRKCSCGNYTRLAENAYSFNARKCEACAKREYNEKMYSKVQARLDTIVKKKTNQFVIQGAFRSGTDQVLPQTPEEYYKVRDVNYTVEVMNRRERMLGTDIFWHIDHKVPAIGFDNYRGKSTIENLVVVKREINLSKGDDLPDDFTDLQVIKFDEFHALTTMKQAAERWKKIQGWDKLSDAEKENINKRERNLQNEYLKRVREITGGDELDIPFDFMDTFNSFDRELEQYELKWLRVVNKFNKLVEENTCDGWGYAANKRKLTVDAFVGSEARLHIIVMTLKQIQVAEEKVLENNNLLPEYKHKDLINMIESVKRCAILWARDVSRSKTNLIQGFTHRLLPVLGDCGVWGTYLDSETGEQWLCSWKGKPENYDYSLPYVDDQKNTKLFSKLEKWKESDTDYLIWTELDKWDAEKKEILRKKMIEDGIRKNEEKFYQYQKLFDTEIITNLIMGSYNQLPEYVKPHAQPIIDSMFEYIEDRKNKLYDMRESLVTDPINTQIRLLEWERKAHAIINNLSLPDVLFYDILQDPF
ncbi:hypothetical protein ACEQLT_004482, partial [Salmonella enterica]